MKTIRVGNIFDQNCPARTVLDRVGDKWSVMVLIVLAEQKRLRFTQLKDHINGVTPKVLTQSLRAMERDGLINRHIYAEVPPRVEYDLTKLGKSLLKAVSTLASWSEDNVSEIMKARAKYDRGSAG
ncbi:transcriptional regulator [Mangrovimicrobium sediminis]|uniref:Transcriptional regulator n=1 Tax=Mangrovimicrobium sediminis TaxID=2562682 RepID=A0A4Z0LWS5_9GAMM|nr:helix-turn-helix domain-containing protein [Haliea sp. SAOS-164]TGD71525.1 transcriptional regulator [Haliea sp. SAOS-164]